MSAVLSTWNRLSGTLPGRLAVSGAVWLRAPYFLTAAPLIQTLEPGRAEVSMRDWWLVHNHLGTVHAIASCNLAEYAMGVLAEATVPGSHRWIPRGMTVEYRAKATGTMHALAEFVVAPGFGPDREDADVAVSITDDAGREVVHATITVSVSPRPA